MARNAGFIFTLVFFLFSIASFATTEEPERTLSDFNLKGFGKTGKLDWELSGKSADIYSEQIKLKQIVGKSYDSEEITLVADEGEFHKKENKVHLEKNVEILTESGTKLTTDYLDWDKDKQLVTTEALVNIEKDNMRTEALGAAAHTDLKDIDLKRDVTVEITPEEKNKIVITCDGPLNINYTDNIAIFNNNVFVDEGENQIYSDKMTVYFEQVTADSGNIEKIVAVGNVKVVRGENISYSQEATYNAKERTITLKGKPKLVIYSDEAGLDKAH